MPQRFLLIIKLLIIVSIGFSQTFERTNSVLSDGRLIKMAVISDGVYKITASDLSALGHSQVNSASIKVFGKGGMLPQKNSETVYFDPPQSAIEVVDNGDGLFNGDDYLLFYAEGPHKFEYDFKTDFFKLQKNYYSDTAYYFLKLDGDNGKRIQSVEASNDSYPVANTYKKGYYFEEELNSRPFFSGREWVGQRLSGNNKYSLEFEVGQLAPNTSLKINSQVHGYTFAEASVDVFLNDFQLGTHPITPVEDYRYAPQGVMLSDTFNISSAVINSEILKFDLGFNPNQSSRISESYIDKAIVMVEKPLSFQGDQISLYNDNYTSAGKSFQLSIESGNPIIWDISNPFLPQRREIATDDLNPIISMASDKLNYRIFDVNTDIQKPLSFKNIENQNLKGTSVPDLLIITHPNFRSSAEELATLRRAVNGYDVEVVDIFELYNEFSSGKMDISAIRNFARYFYYRDENPGKLKYVLLVGKGTYDYKNQKNANLNFIPIYESRNSIHPLATYSSDDYYGFLETNEGEWKEERAGDHTLDISIGRLPVKTKQEADNIVNKLIRYEDTESIGDWRNKVVFVADDGDFNIHNSQSDQLAEFVDTTFNRFNYKKLYLDAFSQEQGPSGEKSPEMQDAINRAVEDGALIINYTGHGGESGWMQEGTLDQFMVNGWNNINKLPLFVTATCEFGRHDSPLRVSAGELTILNPTGGGIGLVTTSRPVLSSSNFVLNKAFYNSVFTPKDGRNKTLGEVFMDTKNNSLNGVGNRNFSLLGDPSMTLAYPKNNIVIKTIEKNNEPSNNIAASSKISISGEIINFNNELIDEFNGVLDFTLYDKAIIRTTLGNESNPFDYKTWSNILFNGKASVTNGAFTVEMIIPKNIDYNLGRGKISMYAQDSDRGIDASGTDLNIRIGGSSDGFLSDNDPPEVQLFMDDENFIDGGTTFSNTKLLAHIYDENGINLSSFGVGQSIELILDNEKRWSLNDYYIADIDDYTSGKIEYSLFDLDPGEHTIELRVWDTFNNLSSSTVTFNVVDSENLLLNDFKGYPNPFNSISSIRFKHNRSGEDLELTYTIFTSLGEKVVYGNRIIRNSSTNIHLIDWSGQGEFNQKMERGLYFVSLSVRSLKDGAKSRALCKIMYQN